MFYELLKSSRPSVSLSFLLDCKLFESKKWVRYPINYQYLLLHIANDEGVSIIRILWVPYKQLCF